MKRGGEIIFVMTLVFLYTTGEILLLMLNGKWNLNFDGNHLPSISHRLMGGGFRRPWTSAAPRGCQCVTILETLDLKPHVCNQHQLFCFAADIGTGVVPNQVGSVHSHTCKKAKESSAVFHLPYKVLLYAVSQWVCGSFLEEICDVVEVQPY